MERLQRIWLRELEARLRAAHAHEIASALAARMQDSARAAAEAERAAAHRMAYAAGLAQHPEWMPYISGGRGRGR